LKEGDLYMVNASTIGDLQQGGVAAQEPARPVFAASKLSAWCDKLIEMGWLAAVVVVPLFFNIYSSRVFEPDKLTTLRSIAIIMALAWLVKWFEERGNPNRDTRLSWRTPLVVPTLILVVIYMISSALSVAPRTSLLGSYQRLQGTYTTLSYIVVFLMMLQGMRHRVQVERLLTAIVLTSFPVSVYGVLQRMQADPLPWGGDTFERVASNMGNSIFVAAYLIMAFFVTVYKFIDAMITAVRAPEKGAASLIAPLLQGAACVVIGLMNLYVVLQLAGSRGPQLGFLAGAFFMMILMVQLIRKRSLRLTLTLATIGLGLAGLAFLLWLNFDKTNPTAVSLRENVPLFRRLSSVMTTTEGTNSVRVLIWEGAAKLVAPHDPITKPDGTPDQWNAIRPLVGYGPESMYVAYNRFYPPALANIEARNASPDRSHNETWDSLVITGIIGFIAYMLVFGSVLYFGFSWIGLIANTFEKWLFVALWIIGGGAVGSYFVSIGSPNLLGVGVAAGIMLGLALFLMISAIMNATRKEGEEVRTSLSLRDQLLLIALISTIVAHFVEIHTGIAIASTRTHFWVYVALMVVIGAGYLVGQQPAAAVEQAAPAAIKAEEAQTAASGGGTRRQRRAAQTAAGRAARASTDRAGALPGWARQSFTAGAVLALVLGIMAFCFTNNLARDTVPGDVFWKAMTSLPAQPGLREAPTASSGVLVMFLSTLLLGSILFATDQVKRGVDGGVTPPFGPIIALIASIGFFAWIFVGTFMAGRLVDFITSGRNSIQGVLDIAMTIAGFPVYVYFLILALMLFGAWFVRRESGTPSKGMASTASLLVGLLGLPVAILAIVYSNLQPIQADIVYKQAGAWDQQGPQPLIRGSNSPMQGWDLAIEHHRLAIRLAPNEDFYYLWLGRALLEKARNHPNPAQNTIKIQEGDSFARVIEDNPADWGRVNEGDPIPLPSAKLSQQDLLNSAKIILEEARTINPLNTDHSANLARMWLQTTDVVADPAEKERRYASAIAAYGTATTLSPNNAQLLNEWSKLHLKRGELEKAQELADKSLGIDKKFDDTYLLRASILLARADKLNQPKVQAEQLIATLPPTATAEIDAAKAALATFDNKQWRGLLEKAVPELEQALVVRLGNPQVLGQLVLLHQQLGQLDKAINVALKLTELNANDSNSWRNLALLYRDNKQKDKAVDAAQRAVNTATDAQRPQLQAFLDELKALP
jgi:tetratricopeptide (TPR) repeat protein